MALKWEKVYVFISSTFNDMHAERDYLVKRVIPDLREWCEQGKLHLIDIDLRWGVTEADAAGRRALKVCLQRINDCRPFFLCFLGQRHGWAPGEAGISEDTFETFPDLREALHPASSITELEIRHAIFRPFSSRDPEEKQKVITYEPARHAFFYFRDPGYLQALASSPVQLQCTYTDDVGPPDETGEERQHRELSGDALRKLKGDIVSGGRAPYPPTLYAGTWKESQSTPELAMPLDCPHQDAANIARWRAIWNRFGQLGLGDTEVRVPARKQSAALKYNGALTRGRLADFYCTKRINEEEPTTVDLATAVKEDLIRAILRQYPDREKIEDPGDLQREIDRQDQFIANSREGFIERSGDFRDLDAYVQNDSTEIFVLTAPGGMGKSMLLGNWVDRLRNRFDAQPDVSIHARFIGQSDSSSGVDSLLRSVMQEIREVYGKLDPEIPDDPKDLRKNLSDMLADIGRHGKTMIVLDALNQLESGLTDLAWIPRVLPQNIKLIVSFKRDDTKSQEVYEQLRTSRRVHFSEVKPFEKEEDRRALVRVYLDQYLKELDDRLLSALVASPGAVNPLYLKVVLSELRVFGAFANLEEKIRGDFGDSPVSAFEALLRRLESDPAYSPMEPQTAVPLLFGVLAHARHGLSVDEMTRIFRQVPGLGETQQSLQAVADTIHFFLRQVRPFLARREGRYDYFYESFKTAALRCYSSYDPNEILPKRTSREWHKHLADCFEGLPTWSRSPDIETAGDPTRRKVSELPYHLTHAGEWNRLETVLSDLAFIEAKCTAGMTYQLMEDYAAALRSEEIPDLCRIALNSFSGFLLSQAHVLAKYPALTVQQAANAPDDSAPAVAAGRMISSGQEKRPWWRWINKLRKETPVMRLEGHTSSVYWCGFSPDGRQLVSAGWDGIRLWEFSTGQQSNPDPVLDGRASYVCFTNEGIWIQQRKNAQQLSLLHRQSLLPLMDWPVPEVLSRITISPDNRFLAVIDGKTIELFNPTTHQKLRTLSIQDESANSFVCHGSFRQDGEVFAAVDPAGYIHVWETKGWEKIMTRKSEAVDLRTCALSPDGRIIALSRPEGVLCEDLHTGKPLSIYRGHGAGVEGCCFSPDGNHLITWARDKSILVWTPPQVTGTVTVPEDFKDFTTKKSGFQTTKWHSAFFPSCAISPDGSFSILTDSASGIHVLDETATERIRKIRNLYADLSGQGHFPATFAFSNDLKMIAAGENTGEVELFSLDPEGEDPISPEEPHAYRVTACSFSPDGSTLLTVSEDRTYHLYQMRSRKLIRSMKAHDAGVNGCSFLQDGSLFVTVSDDRTARIWSTRKGELLYTLAAEAGLLCCSVSTDQNLLAAGCSDGSIRIWDLKDMIPRSVLQPHSAPVRGCWFSVDSKHIVAAYSDGKIIILDADSRATRAIFPAESDLYCASFCAGMERILFTTKDHSLYLLSLENLRRSHASANL